MVSNQLIVRHINTICMRYLTSAILAYTSGILPKPTAAAVPPALNMAQALGWRTIDGYHARLVDAPHADSCAA